MFGAAIEAFFAKAVDLLLPKVFSRLNKMKPKEPDFPPLQRSLADLDKYEMSILMQYLESETNTMWQGKLSPQILALTHDGFLIELHKGPSHSFYQINPEAKRMLQKQLEPQPAAKWWQFWRSSP